MCSDLNLSAQNIILAYSLRFKIEVNFKVLKQIIGVFFYHFWTSAWPKIGEKNEVDLTSLDAKSKQLICQTTDAIEGFVNLGCIATGILQILSLNFFQDIRTKSKRWLRTETSSIPSEETVKLVIQEEFFHNFFTFNNTRIYQIIMEKKIKHSGDHFLMTG